MDDPGFLRLANTLCGRANCFNDSGSVGKLECYEGTLTTFFTRPTPLTPTPLLLAQRRILEGGGGGKCHAHLTNFSFIFTFFRCTNVSVSPVHVLAPWKICWCSSVFSLNSMNMQGPDVFPIFTVLMHALRKIQINAQFRATRENQLILLKSKHYFLLFLSYFFPLNL